MHIKSRRPVASRTGARAPALALAALAALGLAGPGAGRAQDAPAPPAAEPPAPPARTQAGVRFTPAPGWVEEPASSRMRVAQYRLPGTEGEGPAELVVFWFGGQGGSVDANVDRWLGQLEQPDGRATREVAKRRTRTVDGLEVHEVDARGRYVAETRPGSGERVRKDGQRLVGIIVVGPEGPLFFKVVGPEATVARWEASLERFVATLRRVEAR